VAARCALATLRARLVRLVCIGGLSDPQSRT